MQFTVDCTLPIANCKLIYMFRNYLKTAIRNLLRNKTYAAINISGLAVGIAACLLIGIYILHELSYDRYHKNADTVYRVVSTIKEPDNEFTWAVAQIPLAEELQDNYPEVKNAVRFFWNGQNAI